jgi:hypothetical protein
MGGVKRYPLGEKVLPELRRNENDPADPGSTIKLCALAVQPPSTIEFNEL